MFLLEFLKNLTNIKYLFIFKKDKGESLYSGILYIVDLVFDISLKDERQSQSCL